MFRWAAGWQPSGRQQLAAFAAVVVAMAVGLWRVETTADAATAASKAVAQEAHDRIVALCDGARDDQQADREVLLDMLERAGARPESFQIVNDSYDARPPPAACVALNEDGP
jgi:hypothetical protein